MRPAQGLGFIYLSLLAALLLTVIPVPYQLTLFRPDWALLVVMYWTLALPRRVNIGTAFVVGFLTDVLVGTVLGVNALAFSVVSFVVGVNYLKNKEFRSNSASAFSRFVISAISVTGILAESLFNRGQFPARLFVAGGDRDVSLALVILAVTPLSSST